MTRKEVNKRYFQSSKGKETRQKAFKKYFQSLRGKKALRRYHQSPKGKEACKKAFQKFIQLYPEYSKEYTVKYRQTHKEYLKEYQKRWNRTPKGKKSHRKSYAKRRQLGFIPLNKPFEGCEGHHIDFERVIYIPKKLHRSVWHSLTSGIGMDKINKLALEYLEIEIKVKQI